MTVNDILDAYLTEKNNKHADRVCKHPKKIEYAALALREVWGTMTLGEFQRGSLIRIKTQCEAWRAEGYAANTIRKYVGSILRPAFNYAMDHEIIPRTLQPTIKLPASGPPRERVIDIDKELDRLIRALYHPRTAAHIRLFVLLDLRVGQRMGAMLALQWSKHIDFDKRVIRFRDTEDASERSKKRRTDIPMDDAVYALLKAAHAEADCDYVISWRGKPVKTVYVGVQALYRRAGISHATTHDLRRTAATWLGSVKDAAAFIGDTEQVTAKHYAHVGAESRLPQVEKLSGIIEAAEKKVA